MTVTKETMTKTKVNRTFKIVRFYAPDMCKENEVIKTGLTEAEAQAHCQRADTRKEGVYFDGYTDGGE